jgi:hypothetical protein
MQREDLILEILQSVKKEVTDQGKAIARLETSDEYRLDMLKEIKSTIKEVQDTDEDQSESINNILIKVSDLDKRTKSLENINILKETIIKAPLKKKDKEYYLEVISRILPYILGAGGIVTLLLEAAGLINITT